MKSLQIIKNKIVEQQQLALIIARWSFLGEKIVFTNGCFDIVHQGHIDYLSKAADLGTKLVVGVNTDNSVRRLGKAENRPLQDEESRKILLSALHFVDLVVLFDEDTPLELIKSIEPDVLVKGSDYSIENIVGHELVLGNGGEVKTIDFLEGFSTSKIVEKAQLK
ncbi:MAG: D-glycero-beta-D-manno-heptose 1-phosphate adenylyltransferase [Flavobacteriales bacterium]|nr:D-glycero-beta-D-manno-heptose 1-phosphate adenylyltransferase [Flavobacteriales bacterium]